MPKQARSAGNTRGAPWRPSANELPASGCSAPSQSMSTAAAQAPHRPGTGPAACGRRPGTLQRRAESAPAEEGQAGGSASAELGAQGVVGPLFPLAGCPAAIADQQQVELGAEQAEQHVGGVFGGES